MSGYFIIATDAWMQHPVGYERVANGSVQLNSFWQLILNPWAWWQYAHNMSGAVITGTFVMAAVGAFYLLSEKHVEQGRIFVRVGVIVGLFVSLLQIVPTGDAQGRMLARNQPVTLAAMEALWDTQPGAPLVILGQPDMVAQKIDNPLVIPKMLSFLTWRSWGAEVKGLNAIPKEDWPENIPLLYYTYHIMVGLGTIFIVVSAIAVFLLWRRKLYRARWMLWILLLAFPGAANFNKGVEVYVANNGRGDGFVVSAANGWFSFLGFLGMYTVLSVLFLFLVRREIEQGPEPVLPPLPVIVTAVPNLPAGVR